MRNSLRWLFLVLLVIGTTATVMADTFTTASPGVAYSINDGTNFRVSNGGLTSATALSFPSGPNFWQIASSTGYSDAGIVLYFDNLLRLGDLRTVAVTTDNPSAMNINLWLDTGNDGQLFTFSGDTLTGLAGDSYGGFSGTSLDANSLFYMLGGNGAGSSFTLAQLQAGLDPGIGADTGVALWIGVTNTHVATISQVEVTSVPEPASLVFLGTGLAGFGLRLKKRLSR